MKKWIAPEIESLDVKLTASGSEASTAEKNGGFGANGFEYASYDAVNYEKCMNPDGTYQGTVTPKKQNTES